MDEEKNIPYFIHEAISTRFERIIKNLVICLIITVVLLFATNVAWLYAWIQYDYSSEETQIDVDAKDGTANYIGNDGVIYNGEDNR